MKAIKAIIKKEFLQVLRDPNMMRIIFVIPLVQLFILGYAITFDIKNVALVVHDGDRSALSRLLVEKVMQSRRFRLVANEASQENFKSYFKTSRATVGLSIPRDFEKDYSAGKAPQVLVLADGLDSNTSLVALGYLQRIVLGSISELTSASGEFKRSKGAPAVSALRLEPRVRVWFNPNLESRFYMLPGIVAILVTMTTVLLTGMGIVREREIGTLEQLNVSPVRSWQLMLGKTVPFAVLGFILLLPSLAVVAFWYRIPMPASLWLLLGFSLIFLLSTLGVGLLISTLATSQQEAVLLAFFFNIFAILMSGLFAPIHNMPEVVQKLTYVNPVRYFMEIIRGIYLKGSGFQYLWKDGAALLAWGLVAIGLAALRFKKQSN